MNDEGKRRVGTRLSHARLGRAVRVGSSRRGCLIREDRQTKKGMGNDPGPALWSGG